MTRRAGLAYLASLAAALAFAAWTYLTLATDALDPLDATSRTPPPDLMAWQGQVLAAIAVLTLPVVVTVVVGVLAVWAARRRLHNLAWAMGIGAPLTWGATNIAKTVVARPRPDAALPLVTNEGWAYPSGHMATVTASIVLVLAAVVLTRRRRPVLVGSIALAFVAWWVVAIDRWALRAHYATDIVGGALLGGTCASLALAVAGVHVVRLPDLAAATRQERRRAAIVVNPTKITDWGSFRDQVQGALTARGWADADWHVTSADDSGRAGARRARKAHVDLVLVAGGDGTLRTVCAELADSGIPLGILPVGTGNLLARNLGVPLDLADAFDVAFDGHPHAIDLVEVRADQGDVQHSVVMAGLGADAALIAETRDDLKRVVGAGAYVVSGLQAMNRPPFAVTLSLDHGEPVARTPAMVLVASVGRLQGNIELLPDAVPDDGLLDVLVASPSGVADWAALASRVLARVPDAAGAERAQARRVVVEASAPVPYQIDGDAVGACTRLEATIRHHALLVMVPG